MASSMSSFRDQIAKLLYNSVAETCGGYVESVPEDEQTAELLYYTIVDGPIDFGQLADAVIGALRPIIRTVEELDALPLGAVVEDGERAIQEKFDDGKWYQPSWTGGRIANQMILPCILLRHPDWHVS